jgi:hypothetical protein
MLPGSTKLTPDLEKVICTALAATPVIKTACEHAGIARRTYHQWISDGEQEIADLATERGIQPTDIALDDVDPASHPRAHFALATRKARADYLLTRLARIGQAGAGVPEKVTKTVTRRTKEGEVVVETTTTERVTRQWQADAWLIERQFPEFRTTSRHEVTGADGGPLEVSVDVRAQSVIDKIRKIKGEDQEAGDEE